MYSRASSLWTSSWQTCCCRSWGCEHKTSLCFCSESQRLTINQSSRPSTRNMTMCTLTDASTQHVTLRPRLVTWGRCHSTQERVAKVPAYWEVKECVDLPLPSCAHAVHSVPNTASTNVDSVVNGFVQCDVARWKKYARWRRSMNPLYGEKRR